MDKDALREALLNPEPGSAAARARDYGLDLGLNFVNLTRNEPERLQHASDVAETLRFLREVRERNAG